MKIKFITIIIGVNIALISLAIRAENTSPMLNINGIAIPKTFSIALREGMSIPLYVNLNNNEKNQERIGSAFIWLENDKLMIKTIQLDVNDNSSILSKETRETLSSFSNKVFDKNLRISIEDNAWLLLDLKKLNLELIIEKSALGTVLQQKSEDIGASSVDTLSGVINYNLGVYNNNIGKSSNNTSNFLSLDSITSFMEHHFILNSGFYGIGTNQENATVYKAIYERDFSGYRFALGLLDSWSLQSLGPVTAIPSGKIYGFSWGNYANSTIFDNSQSVTPITAFLPSNGEVYLYREGRLLSIQNFGMGNHEVDTRSLPYGIYDIEVQVVVNDKIVDKRIQRVNKLFTSLGNTDAINWQVWGGNLKMDSWFPGNEKNGKPSKSTYLAGVSASGYLGVFSWAATVYGYDENSIAEARVSIPINDRSNLNIQNMIANDGSWSNVINATTTLPGDFSSLWVTNEKTEINDNLRRQSANNFSIGSTLSLSKLWDRLGTLTVSYNNDIKNKNKYYNAEYNQNLYSGKWGSLSMSLGMQKYNNSTNSNYSSSDTDKYITFNFSLPLDNWFSAGMSHQRGYTLANISARKGFDDGIIRTVGVNASRAISGNTSDDKTLSGGGYAQFETDYSSGSLNVNSSADGYVNSNLIANGSVGWHGTSVVLSGRNDGNSGVIFDTNIDKDGALSADINGRIFELKSGKNYLPLSGYNKYDIEIKNSKKSISSYNVSSGRKNKVTLYPGNVAMFTPEIKSMITVFGRIRAEDGTLITDAYINNHIGRTRTNNSGEFIMDIDKKYPTIDFTYDENKKCEVSLNLETNKGAIWVGDVTCMGLQSYTMNEKTGKSYEG